MLEEMQKNILMPMYATIQDGAKQLYNLSITVVAQAEEIKELRKEADASDQNTQVVNLNVKKLYEHVEKEVGDLKTTITILKGEIMMLQDKTTTGAAKEGGRGWETKETKPGGGGGRQKGGCQSEG
jgi:ssRNA-specific RNase YbeY (16S rRNA maturation enzyme)